MVSFLSQYTIYEELGRGGFCVVYRCVQNTDGSQFAVKKFPFSLNSYENDKFQREVTICKLLGDHPNIVKFHQVFSDSTGKYMIFDLVTGGELFHDIVNRESYSEQDASYIIQQVFSAIEYLHAKNIVHRDIKPENLLLSKKVSGTHIKLVDFGLSFICHNDFSEFHGIAGSKHYLAPEVLTKSPYGKPVDIWAAGVVLFALLSGEYAFYAEEDYQIRHHIIYSKLMFMSDVWTDISSEAKELLERILCKDPFQRITAKEVLKHHWISDRVKVAKSFHRQLTIQSLKNFNAPRKFKVAVNTAIASNNFLNSLKYCQKDSEIDSTENPPKEGVNSESSVNEILQITEKYIHALIGSNFNLLRQMVDDKFSYFTPNISNLMNGTKNFEFQFINAKDTLSLATICYPVVTPLSADSALVCFTSVLQYIENSAVQTKESKDTIVFIRSQSTWKILHHHRSYS